MKKDEDENGEFDFSSMLLLSIAFLMLIGILFICPISKFKESRTMSWFDILLIFIVYIIGTLLSLMITGLLANKLVTKKTMQNRARYILRLIKEGKDVMREIFTSQKN